MDKATGSGWLCEGDQGSRTLSIHVPGEARCDQMSYSLNSLKGGYIGDSIGDYYYRVY